MTIGTISTTLTAEVTLGVGGYAAALTVAAGGAIIPPSYTAVLAPASLSNAGLVNSGSIGGLVNFYVQGTVINHGTIDAPGTAKASVELRDGGLVENDGIIGQASQRQIAGVALINATLINSGTIGNSDVNVGVYGVLGGSTAGTINLADFSGFSTIETLAGSDWTLLDSSSVLTMITSIGVTLTEGSTATDFTIAQNTGIETGSKIALQVQGSAGAVPAYVQNDGVILGATALLAPATLANDGTISGGIYARASSSLINSGQILGGMTTSTSAEMYGPSYTRSGPDGISSYYAVNIVNRGTIAGYNAGIGLRNGGTIFNAGTIAGIASYTRFVGNLDGTTYIDHGQYDAVSNFSGNLVLSMAPGAVLTGAVYDRPRNGTLVLDSGSVTGTLDISSFTGLPIIDFVPGAAWRLSESISQLGSETLMNFAAGDTLVVDALSIASVSYAAGIGLVMQYGATAETLHLGFAAGTKFTASNIAAITITGGSNGATITGTSPVAISTISGTVTQTVTPGSAPYTEVILIAPGGTIENTIGVELAQGIVTNDGLITGGAPGVLLTGTGALVNNGLITGGIIGVNAYLGGGSLDNNGTISGSLRGVYLHTPDPAINTGLISGESVGADQTGGYFYNSGSILGATIGVDLYGGRLVNTGNIYGGTYGVRAAAGAELVTNGSIGGGRFAIELAYSRYVGSQFTLVVQPGAVFSGRVADDYTNGTLVLDGSTPGTLDISSFSGFSRIDFESGWTLEGTAAQLATGQTIHGLTEGDSIILDGFSATGESFVAGVGLVLSNGPGSVTLAVGASVANDGILLTTQGTSTTLVDFGPARTISGSVTGPVSLGAGGYNALTVTSTGTVAAETDFGPPSVDGDGLIVNAGTIAGISMSSGTIINNGIIYGVGAINLGSGVLIDSGVISAKADPVEADTLTLILEPGAQLSSFEGPILVDVSSGTGTLVLGAGLSSLSLGYIPGESLGLDYAGFDELGFTSGTNQSVYAGYAQFLGPGFTLSNFARGDTVDVQGFTATGASYVAGTGIILSGISDSGQAQSFSETIALSGIPAHGVKLVTNSDGVEITAPCFCKGTRIATPRGQVAVEDLVVGDLVRTAHNGDRPVRWIGMRGYEGAFIAGNHLALPVRVRRHALGFNVPSRDLYVSPDHALCEGGVLVHAWRLVNGVSVTQAESVERVEYFHVELETHDIIFAENAPVESFQDMGCRGRFQDYVGEASGILEPCRPRVKDGFYLERLRGRINKRAGILAQHVVNGPLRGCVDEDGARLRGWAQDCAAPEVPVELETLHEGVVVGRVIANRYRVDLRRAGLGSGCHAFDVPRPALPGPLLLRRAADSTMLTRTRKAA